MAVKAGGGPDVEKNRQLAQVIADAKVNNVPRDVIERQLSKANAATTIGDRENVLFILFWLCCQNFQQHYLLLYFLFYYLENSK